MRAEPVEARCPHLTSPARSTLRWSWLLPHLKSAIGHLLEIALVVAPGFGHRVAAEFLQCRVAEYQGDHRLCDHSCRRYSAHVGALVMCDRSLTGCDVDGAESSRHCGNRLHRRADSQHFTSGHTSLGAARTVRCP